MNRKQKRVGLLTCVKKFQLKPLVEDDGQGGREKRSRESGGGGETRWSPPISLVITKTIIRLFFSSRVFFFFSCSTLVIVVCTLAHDSLSPVVSSLVFVLHVEEHKNCFSCKKISIIFFPRRTQRALSQTVTRIQVRRGKVFSLSSGSN